MTQPPSPIVLDYGRPPTPGWRTATKWMIWLSVAIALIIGLWFGGRFAWTAWNRYSYQQNWIAGAAALANYQLPSGTVVMDPAAGPIHYMKEYSYPDGGRATWWTLKIPTEPTLEANLRLMHRFDSWSAFPLAREIMTGRGPAFVTTRIQFREVAKGPPVISLSEEDLQMRPGGFPGYRFELKGYLSGMYILPGEGRPLPTILSGELDAGGKSWTLPLMIEGKKEWIRFDHSGPKWAVVTASFGTLKQMGSDWELAY